MPRCLFICCSGASLRLSLLSFPLVLSLSPSSRFLPDSLSSSSVIAVSISPFHNLSFSTLVCRALSLSLVFFLSPFLALALSLFLSVFYLISFSLVSLFRLVLGFSLSLPLHLALAFFLSLISLPLSLSLDFFFPRLSFFSLSLSSSLSFVFVSDCLFFPWILFRSFRYFLLITHFLSV